MPRPTSEASRLSQTSLSKENMHHNMSHQPKNYVKISDGLEQLDATESLDSTQDSDVTDVLHIVEDTLGADSVTSTDGIEDIKVVQTRAVFLSTKSRRSNKITNAKDVVNDTIHIGHIHKEYDNLEISEDLQVSDDNIIITYDNDVSDNIEIMDENEVGDNIEISSDNEVTNDIEISHDISGGIQVIDAETHIIEEVMEDTMDDCLVVVSGETSDSAYQVDNENSQQSQYVEVIEEGTGSESENSTGAMCAQETEIPERKYTIAIELDGGIRVVDGNSVSGGTSAARDMDSLADKVNALETTGSSQATTQIAVSAPTQVSDEVEGQPQFTEEGGMYYIDEEGVYYYQAPGATEAIRVCNEPEANPEPEEITGDINNYDSVTIVPNDNGEDVSYVLIVQQPDDDSQEGASAEAINDTDNNMNVYDFDENEDTGNGEPGEELDDKSTIARVPMKKNNVVLQRHVCHYCNYTSSRRYLLSRHMKSHSEERPHKCNVCERGFKTLASLQNHVNTHTGRKPHSCKFCNSAFTTSGELVRHVRYRHTHEKPHKCKECEYASVELSKLKRHVRCHTGERPYQCPHCTYASPDTFKLKRHLRTHTGERPYVCDMCQMCFTQSNSLKAHKLIHNIAAKPVFACELCPTTCGRKTDLRIHVQKLHTSDKPLKCKRCGKSFPDRYTYKLHNKTHEGEKCFKCEMCPYASISQRHLASHMMIHTDEKPFACDECDQSFRQKQLLRRHQNLYHNPDYIPAPPKEKSHECRECRRQFRHKGNLIRHLAVHDPDSTVHERNLALKLGRQKKLQYMNSGEQIEYKYSLDSDDEGECEDEDLGELEEITMEDEDHMQAGSSSLSHLSLPVGDNQQYVVLEVIELPVENDNHNAAPGSLFDNGLLSADINIDESDVLEPYEPEECDEDLDEEEEVNVREQKFNRVKTAMDKGVDACFGFDEDDGEEEELLLPSKMEPKECTEILTVE